MEVKPGASKGSDKGKDKVAKAVVCSLGAPTVMQRYFVSSASISFVLKYHRH